MRKKIIWMSIYKKKNNYWNLFFTTKSLARYFDMNVDEERLILVKGEIQKGSCICESNKKEVDSLLKEYENKEGGK